MSGDGEAVIAAKLSSLGKGANLHRALGKERPAPSGVTRRRARVDPPSDSDAAPNATEDDDEDRTGDDDEGQPNESSLEDVTPVEGPLEQLPPAVTPRRAAPPKSAAADEQFSGAEPPVVKDDKRSFAYLNQHYGLGTSNGATWRIFRLTPQMGRAPDGTTFPCQGFLGSTDIPIDEEWLQINHGGGRFSCRLNTPDPNTGSPRQRTALTIEIAGPPLQPQVMRDGGVQQMLTGPIMQQGPAPAPAPADSPSVVTKAFDILTGVAERHEQRAEAQVGQRDEQMKLVRQMADEKTREVVAGKERELQAQREQYERQLAEKDARLGEKERQIESLRAQVDNLRDRDPIADVSKLKSAGLLGDGGAAHQELLRSMQSAHAEEMSRMRESHRSEMSGLRISNESERTSLREAHARELVILREAHQRTLDSNEESWKARLARADELLTQERDNVRRIGEQHLAERKEMDERFRTRLADEKEQWKSIAENRYETMVTQKDLRIETLKEEVDRLKGDLHTERSKNVESGDALSQLSRAKSMLDAVREVSGGGGAREVAAPPSTMERIMEVATTPMGQNLIEAIFRGLQPSAPQSAPTVTVQERVPQRQLAAPPLAAPLQAPAFAPPAAPPDLDQVIAADHAREAAHDRERRPQPQSPQPPQQQSHPAQAAQARADEPPAQAQIPQQVIHAFVGQLEQAIADGDTPEEFADEVRRQVPAPILASLLKQMSATDLQRQIDHAFPDSQIASKAGHDFVTKVFKVLGGHV